MSTASVQHERPHISHHLCTGARSHAEGTVATPQKYVESAFAERVEAEIWNMCRRAADSRERAAIGPPAVLFRGRPTGLGRCRQAHAGTALSPCGYLYHATA